VEQFAFYGLKLISTGSGITFTPMKKFAAFFVLFLFTFALQAQTLDERIAEIDAYAQKVMTDWHQPGMAIAIVKDDKVVFAKGYGTRELGKNDPVDADTDFAIASKLIFDFRSSRYALRGSKSSIVPPLASSATVFASTKASICCVTSGNAGAPSAVENFIP